MNLFGALGCFAMIAVAAVVMAGMSLTARFRSARPTRGGELSELREEVRRLREEQADHPANVS